MESSLAEATMFSLNAMLYIVLVWVETSYINLETILAENSIWYIFSLKSGPDTANKFLS